MTANSTPGPWHVESIDGVVRIWATRDGGNDKLIAGLGFGPLDVREADARLVATAPDAIRACKAHDEYLSKHYDGPDSDALSPEAANAWRLCKAAIAKLEAA